MTATTISDTELREVAARLREIGLNPWDDAACEIAQCAGIVCCNSECHGSDETPECTMALCARLADLIEPSCDRDELLEEVKELEKCAYYFGLDFDEDELLRDRLKEASEAFAESARRIREALGKSDG